MALETKTFDEIVAIARGQLRALVTGADVSDGGDYDLSAKLLAAVFEGQQEKARVLALQLFPATASLDQLLLHAAARGLTRQAAAGAVGKVLLTAASGTSTQAQGSTITHADGTVFLTTAPAMVSASAWTGKTLAAGSTPGRIVVAPNTTGITTATLVEINGEVRSVRQVIAGLSCIDLDEPLSVVPSAGTAVNHKRGCVAPVAATTSGAATNKPVGDTATLSSPATGIDSSVRFATCGGGGDVESKDELAARLVAYDSNRPGGGNVEHLRTIAREVDGVRVADAVVFPSFRGLGTVDVIPIGISGARQMGADAIAPILSALIAELPPWADVQVQSLLYESSPQHLDLTVTCAPGYERDFISAGFAIAASPASTTTRIYLTTDPTSVASVGHRIQASVRSAGFWGTYQRTISSMNVPGAGTYYIDVTEPFPAALASTDPVVLPGGPLFDDIVAALDALFDTLGPSRKNTGTGYTYKRHPDPAVAWDDVLRRASITRVVTSVVGTSNLVVTTPASDQTPSPQLTWRRGYYLLRFTE